MLTLAPIWKTSEVELLQAIQLISGRFIRDSFILDATLISRGKSANHEGAARILSQINNLSRRGYGVKDDFETISHDKPDNSGLRTILRRDRGLHAKRMSPHELQNIRSFHTYSSLPACRLL
jgi:hypothetical protein